MIQWELIHWKYSVVASVRTYFVRPAVKGPLLLPPPPPPPPPPPLPPPPPPLPPLELAPPPLQPVRATKTRIRKNCHQRRQVRNTLREALLPSEIMVFV